MPAAATSTPSTTGPSPVPRSSSRKYVPIATPTDDGGTTCAAIVWNTLIPGP